MLQATLKEYQLKGLTWLAGLYEQGINGILADEMVRQFADPRAHELIPFIRVWGRRSNQSHYWAILLRPKIYGAHSLW